MYLGYLYFRYLNLPPGGLRPVIEFYMWPSTPPQSPVTCPNLPRSFGKLFNYKPKLQLHHLSQRGVQLAEAPWGGSSS